MTIETTTDKTTEAGKPGEVEVFKDAEKPFENLPRAEDPMFAYNKATKTFWVGIPVDKADPLVAFAILDSMKINYIQIFQAMVMEAKNKAASIVVPGALNKAREYFLRKTGKA